ncbi:glycoside hydrolase family 97 protein [Bacteroides caecigallinarum]|uniref:glycoside hydrolase family 97 protein n=1 Tax=Bacteroides caecigallinarum TaxID=1411144 RepID=UPI001F4650E6|nr:glycoside hydrolase family 97 protein [Bacteroides caecigallinarum]MCF2594181.1 glycoside hydrolase family 97 protein [Bacteroides caecigallinarum]
MRKQLLFCWLVCMGMGTGAAERKISSPDGRLVVTVSDSEGKATYSVTYDDELFIASSPLGMKTNIGDFTTGLLMGEGFKASDVESEYSLPNIKKSYVRYSAGRAVVPFMKDGRTVFDVEFSVSDNDVAFRYTVYPKENTLCCVIEDEATGFTMPEGTTTFLCPQSGPMGGFARTSPSYETPYTPDAATGSNGWGEGYTFPCLFRNSDKGWILVSETGVDSYYCASHLMGGNGNTYKIGFPNPGEFNGNGTSAPGMALPGKTPWRTITVGRTLAPIVETTVPFDVVEPLYEASKDYTAEYGCGTWSWIIAGDGSMTYDDQKRYVDFCADMGYRTVLVDALWNTQVGYDKVEELARYAKSRNVGLYLWYNSNGYWNDAPQGPRGKMDNTIRRRKEMQWMQKVGIKGIKVDFVGSDKQMAMKLYEDILADANDYGLLVIFHGCTIPRGWERMYPNYAASEAVLASENMNFSQGSCDAEAFNACIHPFVRNTVGSMDFGGSTLNKYYNAANEPRGSRRVTSDVFALATAVLFQSPVQHFAMAPNNLTDAPTWAVDFMKKVPTTWDDVRFIDGYPGKYVVMARRHGDKWIISGVNAQDKTLKLNLDLSAFFDAGETVTLYSDDAKLNGTASEIKINKKQELKISIPKNGGLVITEEL